MFTLNDLSTAQLVSFFNHTTGAKVKKFATKADGLKRCFAVLSPKAQVDANEAHSYIEDWATASGEAINGATAGPFPVATEDKTMPNTASDPLAEVLNGPGPGPDPLAEVLGTAPAPQKGKGKAKAAASPTPTAAPASAAAAPPAGGKRTPEELKAARLAALAKGREKRAANVAAAATGAKPAPGGPKVTAPKAAGEPRKAPPPREAFLKPETMIKVGPATRKGTIEELQALMGKKAMKYADAVTVIATGLDTSKYKSTSPGGKFHNNPEGYVRDYVCKWGIDHQFWVLA